MRLNIQSTTRTKDPIRTELESKTSILTELIREWGTGDTRAG